MTPEERETIIRYDASGDTAAVYSCQPGIWSKMEKYGYKATSVVRGTDQQIISKEFTVPKRCVSLRSGKKRPGPHNPTFGR